jgi:DNA-directed RNA polymerase specialized sigma24 family protein
MTARPIRFVSAALALLALAGAVPAPSRAAEPAPVAVRQTALQRIQRSVARIDREASTPEGEARVVKRLSAQLAMPEDSLRARHDSWALSYGEIAMVYGFARAARRQSATLPDQIVDMRRSGLDWRAIAKKLGVSIDTVASRVRRNEPRPVRP